MKHLALALLLLISALFFALKIQEVWVREEVAKKPGPPRSVPTASEKQAPRPEEEPLAAYAPMVERNLFNPERKEKVTPPPPPPPPPKELAPTDPVVKEVKIAGQQIVLFGTISRGNFKSALINNPIRSEVDKREHRWVKIGDSISNLQVDAIQHDKLILRDGPNRYIILMRDPAKPKPAAPQRANTIMSYRSSPTVVPTDAGAENKAADKPGVNPGQTANSDKPAEDEYEIVKTPFGDKRVKKVKP